jgi:2-polyprenyl-3-methyl-5-hydroxy-6-metoxy-1,4-benzoquinol methylase
VTGDDACWACGSTALEDTGERFPPHHRRCASCGLAFSPERSAVALRELYGDGYYEAYGGTPASYDAEPARRAYEAKLRTALVRRHVAGGSLLEIGCADGGFLAAARSAGFDVLGVEPAPGIAEAARARHGVEVITGFVEDVDLGHRVFDAVCGWHVLEHIREPAGVLGRVLGAVRPGGVLALEVPNAGSVHARRLRDEWPHWDLAHHVAHYTPSALRALTERVGLRAVDLHTFPGTGYYPVREVLHRKAVTDYAREMVVTRAIPRRPHRSRHELLRVVARAPE